MRYFQLWLAFLKMSWRADMEYRLNAVIRVLGESGWYLAQLSIFEVLFLHSKNIAGWDVHGMRVFMASLFLMDSIYMVFNQENLEGISQLVRRGDLDLYLAKPISSQFMVSMRKVTTAYLVNFVVILGYLIWAIRDLEQPVTFWQILSFGVLVASGAVLHYSLRFMFSTLVVILQDAGNLHFLWHQLYRLATRPDTIFPITMRVLMFTVFPVAFFASVPSRILVEGFDWRLVLASVAMCSTVFYLAHRFWNYALKQYSSASS
jgi:ABC-2 type transport system permease protein